MPVLRRGSSPAGSDPYFYDLDGAAARRERAERGRRKTAWRAVLALSVALLALILARLSIVDAHQLVGGEGQHLRLASLLADVLACVMVFAGAPRRRGWRL
jgi:hypothetical protein